MEKFVLKITKGNDVKIVSIYNAKEKAGKSVDASLRKMICKKNIKSNWVTKYNL